MFDFNQVTEGNEHTSLFSMDLCASLLLWLASFHRRMLGPGWAPSWPRPGPAQLVVIVVIYAASKSRWSPDCFME